MTLDERIEYYREKANTLLALGDATGGAEGRRMLRDCKRYRYKVIELKKLRAD